MKPSFFLSCSTLFIKNKNNYFLIRNFLFKRTIQEDEEVDCFLFGSFSCCRNSFYIYRIRYSWEVSGKFYKCFRLPERRNLPKHANVRKVSNFSYLFYEILISNNVISTFSVLIIRYSFLAVVMSIFTYWSMF